MAGSTLGAVLAIVRVVVVVTGVAILRRCCEVAKAAGVDVALHTGKTCMFARQLE